MKSNWQQAFSIAVSLAQLVTLVTTSQCLPPKEIQQFWLEKFPAFSRNVHIRVTYYSVQSFEIYTYASKGELLNTKE
jgi:hypothetical protein